MGKLWFLWMSWMLLVIEDANQKQIMQIQVLLGLIFIFWNYRQLMTT